MYSNLIESMKVNKVSQTQIADLLNLRQATVSDKINGNSKFYFDEALKIKKVFFPSYELEFLFHTVDANEVYAGN